MKLRIKRWVNFLSIGVVHACILLFISLVWLYSPYFLENERSLLENSALLNKLRNKQEAKDFQKEYLFVDLSRDKTTIPLDDALGVEVITDRKLLADFLGILSDNKQLFKFIICDVFIHGKSKHDAYLADVVNKIDDKIVFATHHGEENDLSLPVGLADYQSQGDFFKFKLFQSDSISTIPIYTYEKVTNSKINRHFFVCIDSAKGLCLNSVIVDPYIKPYSFLQEDNAGDILGLSEILILASTTDISEFYKDKIIVIGDFRNDIHKTINGQMPGALILLNVFNILKQGAHIVSKGWFVYMLCAFTVFHFLIIHPQLADVKRKRRSSWSILITSSVLLIVISLLSYLMFRIPLQILILVVYSNLLIFFIQVYKGKWKPKRVKLWLHTKLKKLTGYKLIS